MTSITVALDEQSAEQAERAASERRTTLERLIRDYVDQLAASKARFERLAAEWRREAGPLSSSTDRAMLPAYQAIIGMGRTACRLSSRSCINEAVTGSGRSAPSPEKTRCPRNTAGTSKR
jgi:hypothetical protein